ncbi:41281_t:CDS:2, partial [Gigaspora margarita]
LLYIKDKHTISDQAFNEILKIFNISNISHYQLRKVLGNLVLIEPKLIDICWNSCCAFTGQIANLNTCPICKDLKLQYKNLSRAEDLRYRYEYTSRKEYTSEDSIIEDVFN